MKTIKWTGSIILSLLLLAAIGCSGGGSGGSADGGSGTLSLSLTDATTDGYQAIYVTIKEVRVHKGEADTGEQEGEEEITPAQEANGDEDGSGWETILEPNKTYNLLELVNCTMTRLGDAELAAGYYTQMRLILGDTPDAGNNILETSHPFANYLIDDNDVAFELKVPSGFQSGIKLVRGFNVIDEQTTDLILDFDAAKSVVQAGSSGQWLLKPTIKVLDGDEYAEVGGFVTLDGEGVDGLSVSAQAIDAGLDGGTITEADGSYCLVLEPGTYNLIADELNDSGNVYAADNVENFAVEAGHSYNGVNFELELQASVLPPTVE